MRYFFFYLILINISYAEDGKFRCEFSWKTLSEKKPPKTGILISSLTQKITNEMETSISVKDSGSILQIKEYYKDNQKNFNEYNFSCSRTLSCSGNQVNVFEGKKDITPLKIVPSSNASAGKIGTRDLFYYKNEIEGFTYNYIIYKADKDEPMGLKVSCQKI